MAKWNSINDFKRPSDSYINKFTSPKELLVDLMGEDFYKYEKHILNTHCDEETVKETNDMSVSSGNGTVFPYGISGWHIWNTWYSTDSTCGNNHTVEAGR